MKILIVDDELTNRIILQKFLSPFGDVHTANDGVDAVDFFNLSLEKQKPYDLICLDIMMPNMDGHEALKEIRAVEAKKKIFGAESVKIIMTTAAGDGKNIMKAFNNQCEAYLIKPIDKTKLDNILKKLKLIQD